MSAMHHPFGFVGPAPEPVRSGDLADILGQFDGVDRMLDLAIADEEARITRRANRRWIVRQAFALVTVVAFFGGLTAVFMGMPG